MSQRYICVHGHFYQPPRENPWLDEVEVEESAAPFHDWNARIAAECYGPNAAARILDDEGFIERIINNYSRISFNFGPTLLSWMQDNAYEAYAGLLQGDRDSRERFGGHGFAIAQAYNHVIMPLANQRDQQTQVAWGLRDFEQRFGRRPEGMWLPETAVDTSSLEALAAAGIRFTILAPRQAQRTREPDGEWQDVDEGSLDTTQPYMVKLPSGNDIAVFFYDGNLSHAVAFEQVLEHGEDLERRLIETAGDDEGRPRLGHIAMDGETFGHHHRFGEMALAYALSHIEQDDEAQLTSYGQFLALCPPTVEVEIVEDSSWSCAHGVERWRSDCGCNSGGHAGWNQAWRGPLREALDWLRDLLSQRFEADGATLLRDVWAARNAYIDIVLDRSQEQVTQFFAGQALRPLSREEQSRALKLLEIQRQAMLMYASCAWFFDEVSGIETLQALMHADRAIQLTKELAGQDLEPEFLKRLAEAKSNIAAIGDASVAFTRQVKPYEIDMRKLTGHYAVASVFHRHEDETVIGSYRVRSQDFRTIESGRSQLVIGRGVATSGVTLDSTAFYYAVVHFGDQNLVGGVELSDNEDSYRHLSNEVAALFDGGDAPALTRFLHDHFSGEPLSLRSLFRDQLWRTLRVILAPVLEEAEDSYRNIYDEHASMIRFLASMHFPLPDRLFMASKIALDLEIGHALSDSMLNIERIRGLLNEAVTAGVSLDTTGLAVLAQQALEKLAAAAAEQPQDVATWQRFEAGVQLLPLLPFEVDLWRPQLSFYETVERLRSGGDLSTELEQRLEAIGQALKVRVAVD